MANKSPEVREAMAITVDDLEEAAFEALRVRKEEGDEDVGIGISPEVMFMLCNALRDAGIQAIGAVSDEDQLEFGWTDDIDDNESDEGLN